MAGSGDGSTGGDASTGDTVDPTNVTTNVTTTTDTTTGETDASTTAVDPDTGSTTMDDTDSTTSSTTDAESSSSSSGSESSSSTGDPMDCGNDAIDEGEDCDGAQLDGSTCESLGFVSGDLACADDCTYDTSACESCGNDVVDMGEDCDGDDLAMATCSSIGMGFTGGVLACDAACGFDTTGCTSFAQPAAGEVIISEIMPDPTVLPDSDGEWFEVHNPSADTTYQLGGCEVSGQMDEEVISIDVDLLIPPGGYLTFAPSSMADIGFTPDYTWDVSYAVANAGDVITLSCDGTVVDTVDYDAFPPPAGVSLNLDPDNYDATLNDSSDSWCDATSVYIMDATTDFGTPGAENTQCLGPAVYDIGFCRLQFPTTINEDFGTSVTVYGRMYSAGLTDQTSGNDLVPEVSGQVGYGPDGSDPAVDAGWTWIDATGNPGWDDAVEMNNDEYQATFVVPVPGEYDFAYRFSGDSGSTYTYCDGQNEGSSDGYQIANAGQMTATGMVTIPDSLVLAEVYYDEPGDDGGFEWVKLYNGTANPIDLSTYSIGHGGTSYTYGTYQLSGTIAPGACFVVGGPNASVDNGFGDTPAYDVMAEFLPNIQNSGSTADGVALFDVTADMIAADTVPVDAVIFGGSNSNNLIDETGAAGAVDVGDTPSGDSIALQLYDAWAIQADPTPTVCQFVE